MPIDSSLPPSTEEKSLRLKALFDLAKVAK